MSWRFRQSFTVIPGLRLNLSKSGLSASIGGAPLTLNIGPNGWAGTVAIPGTGISYRHHFPNGADGSSGFEQPLGISPKPYRLPSPAPTPSRYINAAPIQEIHSASTELLTSTTLKELKALVKSAYMQRQEINSDLDSSRTTKVEYQAKFDSWEQGFLLKKVFKKAFAQRKENYEIETAKVDELEQQLKLSTISTQIEIESEQSEKYFRLRDEFASLCDCAAIWDVKTRQATDKFHERTTADQKLERERVRFTLGRCDLLEWDQDVPRLRNAKGGDLFLYPGFILYRAASEAFSLIEYQEVTGKSLNVSFQEEQGVPADAKIIGKTWAKANRDGSRDRRFANNYEIPIALYGSMALKSDNGLWEEFHFSNLDKMVNFLSTLKAFTTSFARVAHV